MYMAGVPEGEWGHRGGEGCRAEVICRVGVGRGSRRMKQGARSTQSS